MATPTTLPATFVVGAVLTAAQQNALRGAFRILQVVSGTTSTIVNSSSTTLADSGLTATITPSATSSKVLVFVSQSIVKNSGNSLNAVKLELLRGASSIAVIGGALLYTATDLTNIGQAGICYLDSPATIAATTYKTQFANYNASASVGVQPNNSLATMILMEVSA